MSGIPFFTILLLFVGAFHFGQPALSSLITTSAAAIEEDDSSFIGIVAQDGIYKYSIREDAISPGIKYPDLSNFLPNLSFDWTRQILFHLFGSILMVPFNAKDRSKFRVVKTVKTKAVACYFEHVESHLYVFYDSDKSVTRFDPYIGDEGKYLVLTLEKEDIIYSLVVDACDSKMYWTNSARSIIQSASTKGQNRNIQTIIDTEMERPRGLTIDPFKKELYWSDALIGKIEKCDLHGKNRMVIVHNRNLGEHNFYGIVLTSGYVYWLGYAVQFLYKADRYARNGTIIENKLKRGQLPGKSILYVHKQIVFRDQCVWRPDLQHWNSHPVNQKSTFVMDQRNRSLSCVYTMDLHTRVEWLHNGKNIDLDAITIRTNESALGEASESILSFERIGLSDAGNYTCRVSNLNFEECVHFIVEICSMCIPKIDKSENKKTLFGGTGVQVLTCRYTSSLQANVTWTHNGMTILESFSSYVGMSGESVIRFTEINLNASGIYNCSAVNEFGEDFFEIDIDFVVVERHIAIFELTGAGIVILILILILGFLWKKHIAQKGIILKLTDGEVKDFFEGKPGAQVSNPNGCGNITALAMPFDQKNEISLENLIIVDDALLGEGQFGLVLRGSYQDRPVAVKTVKPNSDVAYLKALLSEIKIMAFIGNHKRIVEYIGAHTSELHENVVYLVVELSPMGDLHLYIQHNRSQFLKYDDKVIAEDMNKNSKCPMSLKLFVYWSTQIADGMKYLKGKKVVHADLATRNVLMFPDDVVKISDFGLSRQLYGYTKYVKKSKSPLPFRWMALESLRFMEFTSQSDVWSFGVTIWEIFSLGQVPYLEFNWSAKFVQLLVQGLRLPKPDHATVEIYKEMQKCWDPDPKKRVTFEQLLKFFQTVSRQPPNRKLNTSSCEGGYIEPEEVIAHNIDAPGSNDQPSAPLDRCLAFTDDSESFVEFGMNSAIYISV